MIISHSHFFVFIHVPKTGGTTLTEHVGSLGLPQTTVHWGIDERSGVDKAHLGLRDLGTYEALQPPAEDVDRLKTYQWYACVRDPYERFCSAQQYLKRTGVITDLSESYAATLRRLRDTAGGSSEWPTHLRPMVSFCCPEAARRLGVRLTLLRVEAFHEDVASNLLARHGLSAIVDPNRKARNTNPGRLTAGRAPAEAFYFSSMTPEEVRLVNELYAEDFAAFGYSMRQHPMTQAET